MACVKHSTLKKKTSRTWRLFLNFSSCHWLYCLDWFWCWEPFPLPLCFLDADLLALRELSLRAIYFISLQLFYLSRLVVANVFKTILKTKQSKQYNTRLLSTLFTASYHYYFLLFYNLWPLSLLWFCNTLLRDWCWHHMHLNFSLRVFNFLLG